MRTIGLINWKGDVGKTSIAINTAYALAESWGAKVLFVDMDKQANASDWFGRDESKGNLGNLLVKSDKVGKLFNLKPMTAEEVIQKTRYPNIDLIAGDSVLLDVNLGIMQDRTGRQDNILSEAMKPVQGKYDVCVIDNPPDSNIPVLNGLEVINDLIAVTLPNRFSLSGVYHLEREINNYNEILGLDIAIRGIVVNQFTSTPGCYEIVDELRSRGYGDRLLPHIRGGRNTHKWLDRVINEQKSIYELSPGSGFARDLLKFIENLVG